MTKIKAPFNFVPLSDKVFFPDWAEKISLDVPFNDGLSGKIKIIIKAHSPIFVPDGQVSRKNDDKDKGNKELQFCHTADGKYFIPATSVKGALRNVLEIISFGKMSQSQVQDGSFGIRDLSNSTDGTFYRSKIKTENIRCGYLSMSDNGYVLEDHGLPWRISAEALENKYGCGLLDFIKDGQKLKKDENRTAQAKYKLFKGCNLTAIFEPDEDLRNALKVGNRQFVRFSGVGDRGEIVFTGQSGKRERNMRRRKKDGTFSMTGKFFEFVFPEQKGTNNYLDENSSVIRDFLSIHKNSPDFKDFRKKELEKGCRIPVFFMYNEDGNVDSIGLAYMYKYPAFNTIYGGIPDELQSSRHDLAECIFGYASDNDSLRGRVQFSHAVLQGEPKFVTQTQIALSSPRPSFYPFYLGNGYTWNSPEIRIAGRKRYPVRNKLSSNKGTDAMSYKITPLDKGAEFVGYIAYHNLRPAELGALLSSISLLGHSECYHSLGHGKPLGYGKVKINYEISSDQTCIKAFEDEMTKQIPDWKTSSQIRELIAMAGGIPEGREDEFNYLIMSTDGTKNEFKVAKAEYAAGQQLGLFTQIISGNVPVNQNNVAVFAKTARIDIGGRRLLFEEIMDDYRQNVDAEAIYSKIQKYTKQYGKHPTLQSVIDGLEKSKLADKDFEDIKAAFERKRFSDTVKMIADYKYPNHKEDVDEMRSFIKEQRVLFEKIKAEALEAKAVKDYVGAIAKFRDAETIGFEPMTSEIQACEYYMNVLTSDIKTFLQDIDLTKMSKAAFAGRLKKRSDVSDEDLAVIAQKIKDELPNMKKADQKTWTEFERWKDIAKVLGDEKAKKVFDMAIKG